MLTEKQIYDLNRKEQLKLLEELGVDSDELKKLKRKREKARVKKILELQDEILKEKEKEKEKKKEVKKVEEKKEKKEIKEDKVKVKDVNKLYCIHCGEELKFVSESPDHNQYICPYCKARRAIHK